MGEVFVVVSPCAFSICLFLERSAVVRVEWFRPPSGVALLFPRVLFRRPIVNVAGIGIVLASATLAVPQVPPGMHVFGWSVRAGPAPRSGAAFHFALAVSNRDSEVHYC